MPAPGLGFHLPRLWESWWPITGANRSDRQGAVFTIALPIPKPTEQLDTAA